MSVDHGVRMEIGFDTLETILEFWKVWIAENCVLSADICNILQSLLHFSAG
jgi:hypothetical protein